MRSPFFSCGCPLQGSWFTEWNTAHGQAQERATGACKGKHGANQEGNRAARRSQCADMLESAEDSAEEDVEGEQDIFGERALEVGVESFPASFEVGDEVVHDEINGLLLVSLVMVIHEPSVLGEVEEVLEMAVHDGVVERAEEAGIENRLHDTIILAVMSGDGNSKGTVEEREEVGKAVGFKVGDGIFLVDEEVGDALMGARDGICKSALALGEFACVLLDKLLNEDDVLDDGVQETDIQDGQMWEWVGWRHEDRITCG